MKLPLSHTWRLYRTRDIERAERSKLVFIGNYGNRNVGDDAILHLLSDRYHERYAGHDQYVFARQDEAHVRRISHATPIPTDPRTALWALWHAQVIVIGGGGIFGARMGPAARFIPLFALLAQMLGKRVIYE